MATQRRSPLELDGLITYLNAQGWEVVQAEPIIAVRSDLPGVWKLFLDKGGRVRLQRRYYAAAPKGLRRQRQHRLYYLHGERVETIDITTTLQHPGEFPAVLSQMIEWALDPPLSEKEQAEDV